MATQSATHVGRDAAKKLMAGEHLDETEKSHLSDCDDCMLQVVVALDEYRKSRKNGSVAHLSPLALKALEKGRRAFEREFGISLPRSQSDVFVGNPPEIS